MRAVSSPEPGVVEVNWMWLPTFIGLNKELMARAEAEIGPKLLGRDLTDEVLDEAHELVVDFLVESCPGIEGLREFLDGLKYVQYTETDGSTTQAGSAEPQAG